MKSVRFLNIKHRLGELDSDIADMLRYDCAFISAKHPGVVAFPTFKTRSGDLGGAVTRDRWRSFGVALELPTATDMEIFELRDSLSKDDWYSFRHPRMKDSTQTDYGRLVKVLFEEFLKIDHPSEIVKS